MVAGSVPDAIARALTLNPPAGTTFRDAEHVVILMQENRSFDHAYGALQGVRGFRDPRAHTLPNGNPVWFQTDAHGDTYAPFRLDITGTSATWIGSLPHSWVDQIDAHAQGRYDQWLLAKAKPDLPFTLGHYARPDIPFYYALADAFTVCDQAFCSSLTGTTANRLYLWSGAIRGSASDAARVLNEDTTYEAEAAWTTYLERLEDAGVSWRIYQNELSIDTGLTGDEDAWLSNFTDNPIEWFTQFNVRYLAARRAHLPTFLADTPGRIVLHERALASGTLSEADRTRVERELSALRRALPLAQAEAQAVTDAGWAALSERARSLHRRAFTTNVGDPHYRTLASLGYDDRGTRRELRVPAGDVLFQFRRDVASGELPAVSWLVAPENFSDHPGAPWYGAWYVSEVLDILTANPEVWKRTVFILCYDENDGYFDHVPPYLAPHPSRPETGKVSSGIDTATEWGMARGREHSVGLGFRVPLVIASPWSRGGVVNSQVFDHTSVLRFLEVWLAAKGKQVIEPNISAWRRTVCGDLTSAFRPYDGERVDVPVPLDRDATLERIHAARFRDRPKGGAPLTPTARARADVAALQEPGTRPSCPLPYDLVVNADARADGLGLTLEARHGMTADASQGAPFAAYVYTPSFQLRSYAVRAGDVVRDVIPGTGAYRVRVDGPNGFMRQFEGPGGLAALSITADHEGQGRARTLAFQLANLSPRPVEVTITDESYGGAGRRIALGAGARQTVRLDLAGSQGWYDVTVRAGALAYRYAGRVETGEWSITDPAMGRA